MAQDIKKLLQESKEVTRYKMPVGHEKRFEFRLDTALSQRRKWPYGWLNIAASIVVVVSVSYFSYRLFTGDGQVKGTPVTDTQQDTGAAQITLGNISPELKKIEDYYVANINVALSELSVNNDN
ncbi:MAG: hypothetical protein KDD04_03685, partial [Sinomicrobium sp.]|nr:hypothetical protein [Sinomicrobium sp.]